jgi:hypothetical protein
VVVKEPKESEETEDFLVSRDYVVLLECMENQALKAKQVCTHQYTIATFLRDTGVSQLYKITAFPG